MEELIRNWVLPLVTLGGVLVAIVLYITKKDSSQDVDINVMNTNVENISKEFKDFKFDFREFRNDIHNKFKEFKTNDLLHIYKELKEVNSKINSIDKKLFAHLEEHHHKHLKK